MDDSIMSDPVSEYGDSDAFSPAPVKKSITKKPAVTKTTKSIKPAAAKKAQSTKSSTKTATKKRQLVDSDDENASPIEDASLHDQSILDTTPPSAKKQKKIPAIKKTAMKPLKQSTNGEDDSINMDGPSEVQISKPKGNASDRYQKLTQLEHIVKRPDTYIGSVEQVEQTMWVFNSEREDMELRKVKFVPGLYKIFDEILVNAADNKQNDESMKNIKVTVNKETGEISVENDGRGIPVEIHNVQQIYIPEMIFGHLLTSSNYDDDQAKVTGGRNGYGAKLANIFSTSFTLETQDNKNVKRYKQTWTDNMSKMGKASIKTNKSSDFTRVTFTPDYNRFGMKGIDDDFEALIKRRTYDMAGTVKGVSVYLNGVKIKINNFEKYMKMYTKAINRERGVEDSESNKVIIDDVANHKRWEIGFAVSDGSFQQVSFVNSIATTSGGTHVDYVANQISTRLLDFVQKKNKQGSKLKLNQVRNHIFLFVNCQITNPAFTSQTKEQLTTKVSQFGSKCVLTEEFMKKICKTDAIENIMHFAAKVADKELAKSDGNRRSRMNNPKLVDANLAGTKRGWECTLILTEGDSAKGLAVAGRAVLDPDKIGVFPLRGKLLNVRDASVDQITKNAEIQAIKQFLGLKHKQTYTDTKGLRYGHLMIMADQDHDGSHIKGLLINFLEVQFPSLLKLPDFFREFITPIVKVWKGPNPKKAEGARSFFTMPQYYAWKDQHKDERGWHHKYFKGLGTSSTQDAQVYFRNLDDHLKEFMPMQDTERSLFELAFSKKKADERKRWLGDFVPGTFLDHSTKTITYDNFVNRELILFSMADNLRSIPSVIDGLKPGQRKVIYAALNRPVIKDTKVVELAGYVSELTAYQHGEASLQGTIIGLAQDFVGSNNVNILEPSGNFGSRLAGGTDSASPRYIYTRLSPFARALFTSKDDPSLERNTDDDRLIEPKVYCPVVPLILLNGADGIGTGWSTSIPNYNPEDVVDNLKCRMGRLEGQTEEGEFQTMTPWYRGWKGEIELAGPDRYKCNGRAIANEDTHEIEVTELPVRVWTDDFKARLEDIIKGEKTPSFIKDYKEFNDHANVHFIIQMDQKSFKDTLQEGMEERFKLQKTIATSNLVAFNAAGQIKRYEKVEHILEEYYDHRLAMYTVQKAHWLDVHDKEFRKLSNQARFVTEIIENKLIVSKKKKPVLVAELRAKKYEAFSKLKDAKKVGEDADVVENTDDPTDEDGGARDFDYLLGLPIWSLTQERVDKLHQQMAEKKATLDRLKLLTEKDLWCADLDEFMKVWQAREVEEQEISKKIRSMGRRASKKLGAGGKATKASARMKTDDDYAPKISKATTKPAARPKASIVNGITKVVDPKKSQSQKLAAFGFSSKPRSKSNGHDGAEDSELDVSDADFGSLDVASKDSRSASEVPSGEGRTKRAAATNAIAKQKTWLVESDSELDDDALGNIGAMVKGIANTDTKENSTSSRLALHTMARSESSAGPRAISSALSKAVKPKVESFEISENDDTNYELLARSSPVKSPLKDELEEYLSDDDKPIVALKPLGRLKVAAKPKVRPVTKVATIKEQKSVTLSPAAKAYAAKQKKATAAVSLESDNEEDQSVAGSPVPKAKTTASRTNRAITQHRVIESDDLDSELLSDTPPNKGSKRVMSDDDESLLADSPPKKVAKIKPTAKPVAKATSISKATIKSKPKQTRELSEDDSEEDVVIKPVARGRPARAAVTKPKKSAYVDFSEEEEDGRASDGSVVLDEESEDFDESD